METIKLDEDELKVLKSLVTGDKSRFWKKFQEYIKNHYPEYDPLTVDASIQWHNGIVRFKEINLLDKINYL